MNKVREIFDVKIEDLIQHPKQAEIYGDNADDKLIASIKLYGLKTPVELAKGELYGYPDKWVIISGHRRVDAYKNLEFGSIEAIDGKYEDEVQADLIFIISNEGREKTELQKINEFLKLKQILRQILRTRRTLGKSADKVAKERFELRYDVVLNSADIDIDQPLTTRDLIAQIQGISKYQVDIFTMVFDDEYLDNLINKYRELKVLDNEATIRMHNVYDEFRAKVLNGKMSYKKASEEVMELKKELEDEYKSILRNKAKKEKLTKAEEAKISKIPQPDTAKVSKIKKAKPYQLPVNELFTNELKIRVAYAPIIATNKSKTTRMYFIGTSVLIDGKNGLKRISQLALLDAYNKIG